MSESLYDISGLRFWNEDEIQFRNLFQERTVRVVQKTLQDMNPAWKFHRCEAPTLMPINLISDAYSEKDIFVTNHEVLDDIPLALRAETTYGSYTFLRNLYPQNLRKRLPVCIWQSGISYRRENVDGATAAKLRYNAFYQLEFQCVYSNTTMADYREELIKSVSGVIERFVNSEIRVVDSDRLPSYSESTKDIECLRYNGEKNSYDWKEVASCSIRNDFSEDTKVAEIAIGLCRIVDLSNI